MCNPSILPHTRLRLYICYILSFFQMKDYKGALEIFRDIGSFDDEQYQYESYPSYYPGKTGNMIPYSLKLLYHETLYYTSEGRDLNGLFSLFKVCKDTYEKLGGNAEILQDENYDLSKIVINEADNFMEIDESSPIIWRERIQHIAYSIISKYISKNEFILALDLANYIRQLNPNDKSILILMGRIYIQVGDVTSTEKIMQSFDENSKEYKILNGIRELANGNHHDSLKQFMEVFNLDKSNVDTMNNIALCHLFMGNVNNALTFLEDLILSNPKGALNEIVLQNLSFFYTIINNRVTEKKIRLLQTIIDHADDSLLSEVIKFK